MSTEARAEVNQRALVDKVLSRYSGEFTIFRELLQNADDAGPSNPGSSVKAEIHFTTAAYYQQHESKLGSHSEVPLEISVENPGYIVEWMFRNDGKKFDEGDWKRLPSIAEGNPDPEKIGAFGVGFYSVFSVTDGPRVLSGGRELCFYWKKDDNQLYTCHGTPPQQDSWTTFKMPLREPRPMLSIPDLVRFLASSITFMANLTTVSIFLDNDPVGHVKKSLEPSRLIDVLHELNQFSPKRIMEVKEVRSHSITIDAEIKNTVCTSASKGPWATDPSKFRVNLSIFTAEVDVMADEKISGELCRCMKKKPPSRLEYNLIYTGKDDHDRNSMEQQSWDREGAAIFQGLYADLDGAKHTRIFIGHATRQTTSIGGHMASRFIPTVERESIDFVDKYVSLWNTELLYVGGLLCRVVYELELSKIQHIWEATKAGTPDPDQRSDLERRFLHLLKFFAFYDSSPSSMVSQVLHESFYKSSNSPLRLLSSVGVHEAPQIRAFDPRVAKFLDSIPMLSEHISQEAVRIIDGLPAPCKILPISVEDVIEALRGYPLSEERLIFCLRWWMDLKQSDSSLCAANLLNATTLNGAHGTRHLLSEMEYFLYSTGPGAHIPREGPLPGSLISFNISSKFTRTDLTSLGWREFTVFDWFQHISGLENHEFTKAPNWPKRVLYILSRAWTSFSDEERQTVKAKFEDTRCIPTGTSNCLCRPCDSYFPVTNDVLLHKFGLPVIAFTSVELDKDMRALFLFIGVQARIPLQLLRDRMLHTGEWGIADLVNHLVRLSPPLTEEEISILKSSSPKPFFYDHEKRPCTPHELYPPVDIFHRLTLPVIFWEKSEWLNESDEARLLYRLGINSYPPLKKIIELCTSPNKAIGETAFMYFCDNFQSKYSQYNPQDFHNVEFVPAENKEGVCLKSPDDVFLGLQWKALGFSIVRNACRKNIGELGIRQDPPASKLLHLLETRPPSSEQAQEWYECLSECTSAFTQPELAKLTDMKIVPTNSPNSSAWLTPTQCYVGTPTNEFYRKLFVFVDFGTKANYFLSVCGSMKGPSIKDVAESLVEDPVRFYKLAGSDDSFLDKLRDLATRRDYIPNDTLYKMSHRRTLLGKRRERANAQEEWKYFYELRTAEEIVIVDDTRDYDLFGEVVHVAPRDDLLERFYASIGCRRLSTVVHEQYEKSPAVTDTKICSEVRALILERLDSFLQKCSHYQYNQVRDPRAKKFSVVICERILVHKTLIVGENQPSRKQDMWAVTKRKEDGSIELWLSRYAKQDMYDLAASLCRLLFSTFKDTDTFLLAAMLSSDVELLKRAGFNVDQFSKQKPAESPGGMLTEDGSIITDDSRSSENLALNQGSSPRSTLGYIRCSIADTVDNARGVYQIAKDKLISNATVPKYAKVPHQLIRQNLVRDIVNGAVSSRSGQLLNDKRDMVQFLREHSCSDFAQVGNLWPLGITPQGVQVHVAGGVPDVCAFIAGKQDLLSRFIQIITPAINAHKLPIELLHIFYTIDQGPIAFNSEGDIYLNLKYFEEWHDEDVQNGNVWRAQSSWFFALAHEIAHNLIPLHDAAHEFWFSAICEDRLDSFFAATGSAA